MNEAPRKSGDQEVCPGMQKVFWRQKCPGTRGVRDNRRLGTVLAVPDLASSLDTYAVLGRAVPRRPTVLGRHRCSRTALPGYDDEPCARRVNITLPCRRTRPSAQKSGCTIAEWYGQMGPMPQIRSEDRLAAGNSENCLPRAPGRGGWKCE